jgi:protein HOOK3
MDQSHSNDNDNDHHGHDHHDHERQRHDAMLEFINCFPNISHNPTELQELNDGVVMFQVLSDISPNHFDPTTITQDLGANYNGNWALKANNLRKLFRNLEIYFHEILHKQCPSSFDKISNDISSIARGKANVQAIACFVELIIAAAVMSELKSTYVGWIMNMSDINQVVLKGIIQDSLSQLEDFDGEYDDDYDNDDDDDEQLDDDDDDDDDMNDEEESDRGGSSSMNFDDYEDDNGSMTGLFKDAMSQFNNVTEGMDLAFDASKSDDNNNSNGIHNTPMSRNNRKHMNNNSANAASMELMKEREELRKALSDAKKELSNFKNQSQRMVEDTESSQKKLRALAEDLQERLGRREHELSTVEDTLYQTKRELEDAQGKIDDLTDKKSSLEDELDISNAKAMQLRKAEATVVAYRKKLEGVGVMNQQMNELEDQSAKYLGQIMDLEMETKKVPELQKNLEQVKRDLIRVQKEKEEVTQNVTAKVAEISQLKTELKASTETKKMFEDELNELRSIQDTHSNSIDDDIDITGLSLTSAKSMTEVREKAMRLEIENKNLKKQLGIDINAAVGSSTMMVTPSLNSATATALEEEVQELQAAIYKKEALIKKLSTDKDRLEAYTKKTLAKFQEKYLVALQECKAKLKEKHDKIEQLELRSASEKSNQKREEKLLSSAMYELGLSIMQQKLKER